MSTQHTAQKIMRRTDVSDPIAHGFVDGVFQSARSRIDSTDFGSQQAHAENVQFLSSHVLGAHVDDALEAQESANGSCGHAMLSRTGFRDYPGFAHALN